MRSLRRRDSHSRQMCGYGLLLAVVAAGFGAASALADLPIPAAATTATATHDGVTALIRHSFLVVLLSFGLLGAWALVFPFGAFAREQLQRIRRS